MSHRANEDLKTARDAAEIVDRWLPHILRRVRQIDIKLDEKNRKLNEMFEEIDELEQDKLFWQDMLRLQPESKYDYESRNGSMYDGRTPVRELQKEEQPMSSRESDAIQPSLRAEPDRNTTRTIPFNRGIFVNEPDFKPFKLTPKTLMKLFERDDYSHFDETAEQAHRPHIDPETRQEIFEENFLPLFEYDLKTRKKLQCNWCCGRNRFPHPTEKCRAFSRGQQAIILLQALHCWGCSGFAHHIEQCKRFPSCSYCHATTHSLMTHGATLLIYDKFQIRTHQEARSLFQVLRRRIQPDDRD